MYEELLKMIEKHDSIVLFRHNRPDGDALGSQIGLMHLIRENYPEKEVCISGDAAGRYAFMPGSDMPEVTPDDVIARSLVIVLDCGGISLVCGDFSKAKATARMDHHLYTGAFTETEVIDSSYESCCGLITDFAVKCGWRFTKEAAEALITGMITDSGRFRYDSTTSATLRSAAMLMDCGVELSPLYRELYANDFEQVQLKAHFTMKIQRTGNGVAYLYITREEMEEMHIEPSSVYRTMVGLMADIRGIEIWVSFIEAPQGVMCELRSDRYNINPIAVKYGGGGHKKASGATIPDKATAMAMLEDLKAMLA